MIDEKLAQEVAARLTGMPVVLRLRCPAIREYDGEANIVDGVGFIDIRPTLSDDGMLKALLHEAGHLKARHLGDKDCRSLPGSKSLETAGQWLYKNDPVVLRRALRPFASRGRLSPTRRKSKHTARLTRSTGSFIQSSNPLSTKWGQRD